jgi:hypothetical protein
MTAAPEQLSETDKDRAHRLKVWDIRQSLARHRVKMHSLRYAGLLAVIAFGLVLAFMVLSDLIDSHRPGPARIVTEYR